jgi:hypothetical protein
MEAGPGPESEPESACSEPGPEPGPESSEPEPEPMSEDVPEGEPPNRVRASPKRESPVLKDVQVSVLDLEGPAMQDHHDVEGVDVNAPLSEVLCAIEDSLNDQDLRAEDIAFVYITHAGGPSNGHNPPVGRRDYAEATLAESGYEDTCVVLIMTDEYVREKDARYGRRGNVVEYGDFEGLGGEDDGGLPAGAEGEKSEDTVFEEPSIVFGKHRVKSTMVYDFRRCAAGTLPPGVAVVDPAAAAAAAAAGDEAAEGAEPAPELEEQNDKSMALKVSAGQYVELDLDPDAPSSAPPPRAKQRATTEYTLTLDFKVEELPTERLALFSPSSEEATEGGSEGGAEGLCQLDKYGGVGAYAQFGVKEACVQAGRWSRVVVTVKLGQEQGMTTYVAGPKGVTQCAQVRSNYFVPRDGAQALLLSKGKMRLFFSASGAHAVGEKPLLLKYVSVKRRHMDKALVEVHVQRDRIFSYWQSQHELDEDEQKRGSLFLHGVQGARMGDPLRTVPLFWTPPFLCEFASGMLRNSVSGCLPFRPFDSLRSCSMRLSSVLRVAELDGRQCHDGAARGLEGA